MYLPDLNISLDHSCKSTRVYARSKFKIIYATFVVLGLRQCGLSLSLQYTQSTGRKYHNGDYRTRVQCTKKNQIFFHKQSELAIQITASMYIVH